MHEDLKAVTVKLKPNQRLHTGTYIYVYNSKNNSIHLYEDELLQDTYLGTVTPKFIYQLSPEVQQELNSIFDSYK